MFNLLDLGINEELERFGFDSSMYKRMGEYATLIPYLTGQRLDKWNAHVLANKFLEAQDLTSELYSIAIRVRSEIEIDRKRQKALAYHERSLLYLDEKRIKHTDSAKSSYVDMDLQVIESTKKAGAIDALCDYLERKFKAFNDSFYLCKQAHSIE